MKNAFARILFFGLLSCLFSCRTVRLPFCITLTNFVPEVKQSLYDPVTRTLRISWDTILCAHQYQLEWTFAGADDSATLGQSWIPDFRFNSTRIVTTQTHYEIPVIYEEGTLIYRLRCVKRNDSLGQALLSSWSKLFEDGKDAGLANLWANATFRVGSSLVHEGDKLNWQYSSTYFDEGARKDNVQYLDGTLRQRQMVTYSRSDTLAFAMNTIYDFNGRAAIRTLPAPVMPYARHLGYFPGQVLSAPDTVYTYRQFDVDGLATRPDSCYPSILRPGPLSTAAGVSAYFSTSNPDTAGFQAFVPDAGGFPFLQMQWMDDNTQRPIRQSGPGKSHFIGSNHEYRFRYADVAQDEVDMLFGNDAGDERFYKKTIQVDPNGQMSIEFRRIDGKVVASALAGPVPSGLDSVAPGIVPVNVDIVGIEQMTAADGLSKYSSKSFDLSINTSCAFGYRLLPRHFEKNLCTNTKVCLDCRYIVQLTLRDQDGTILHQVDTAIGTLSQNCAPGNTPAYRTLFTKVLCKGNYTVSRTISIDTTSFENYYRSYLVKADSCGDTSVSFPEPEPASAACSLTCQDCNAMPDSLMTPCDHAKEMMMINVSPGGQYAQYELVLGNVNAGKFPLSIYNSEKWRTITTPAPPGLQPYIDNNDLNGLVNNWKTEWAEYFLPLHPEYCYYRSCEDNKNAYVLSKRFNDRMLAIPNARMAVTSVFMDPVNNDPSLNALGITAIVKTKLNNFRNGKNIKEFIYSGFLGCKSVPPYSNNFASTPDTFANNMQWQMFRAMYMSLKNQVIDSLREVEVKNKCGGPCNKCIGDSLHHYTTCRLPNCNVPADSICDALRYKSKIFPSTFDYQEQLPFRLTGIDSLDLAIIQHYTATKLPINCRCGTYDQLEHLFRYALTRKKFDSTLNIPDTLCSVGIAYETLPGYRGDLRWVGVAQPAGGLDVTLFDTLRNSRCTMNFITVDSLIPWNRIVLTSCLRANRIPTGFSTGPNIFLVDLYDSTYKKYTAEARISCVDTGFCKPAKSCTPVCDDGLTEIFNCGFTGGTSSTINLKDPKVLNWVECIYDTKIGEGKISWRGIRSGEKYLVTLTVDFDIKGNNKLRRRDSCQYEFDFGKDIVYAGTPMEVIHIEPDRTNANDTCRIFGIRMILKIQVENLPPRYITVTGRPSKDCFPVAECCKPLPPKKCPNEFSNRLSVFNSVNTDTVLAQLGIADTIWAKKFALGNSGYYDFAFNATIIRRKGIPVPPINTGILSQLIDLRVDDSVFTQNLLIRDNGNLRYTIRGRIPIRYKRYHNLQVELKTGPVAAGQVMIRAYNFSLVAENCSDCCLPVFPPIGTPDPGECDSTKKNVNAYNRDIVRSQYLAELRAKLKLAYIQHCMSNIDSFMLTYSDALYHFTLYYYDQANNLVSVVPPKGVHLLPADSVQHVQAHRRNPGAPAVYPAHTFRTTYRFNTLNDVTEATAPDAGTTRNWYDLLGRLVIRQEARQVAAGKFNYTLYDQLSRIIQSGECVSPGADIPALTRDSVLFANTLRNSVRYDVNNIVYDQPMVDSLNGLTSVLRKKKWYGDSLNYLRHRIAASFFIDTIAAGANLATGAYRHAVHYWYDMHGLVRMLVHELPELKSFGQNLKRIAYDYEVLNGQVKKIKYQQGEPDQFFTRYTFDADNRMTAAFTSLNDLAWDRDARYFFSKHRLLARMEIGDGVQGVDYVYTIQGFQKSINGYALVPGLDPGRDGDSTGNRRSIAPDVFGYEIGYYRDDYKPIRSSTLATGIHASIYDSLQVGNGLYNGNIRYLVKGLQVPALADKIQATVYGYDQLSRLTSSAVYPVAIGTGYLPGVSATNDYRTKLRYDPNGNILSMLRNGAAAAGQTAMDALSFHYNSSNNQLQFVSDTVNSSRYGNDVDRSLPGNYQYDQGGNLVRDIAENIDTIRWNARGKIAAIIKDGGASSIHYTYSTLGDRFSVSSGSKTTYYITDLEGKILATYIKDTAGVHNRELTIFGNKRLGIFKRGTNQNVSVFVKGDKQYEINDHLGNVLLTVSDRKVARDPDGDGKPNYYTAEVVSAADYYPFGMLMPLRTVNDTAYRYGFNGKEKDDEVKGSGNQLDFGSRIYDSRLGRFLSLDPAAGQSPSYSPYTSSGNNPVLYIDIDGEAKIYPPKPYDDILKKAYPEAYRALEASNNTSPYQFYRWAIGEKNGTFPANKGAFGEAEHYKRITEGGGVPHTHEIPDPKFGTAVAVSRYPAEFGQYYKGEQVDVQQTVSSSTLLRLGIVEFRHIPEFHPSSFEGDNDPTVFLGKDVNATFTINYEVKNLSPMVDAESSLKNITRGVEQAIARTAKNGKTIGILVTDKATWMKIYSDKSLRPKLKAQYDKLRAAGAYLQLDEGLDLKSSDDMFDARKLLKKEHEKRNPGKKEE